MTTEPGAADTEAADIDATAVLAYVGGDATDDADGFAGRCAVEATELVAAHVGASAPPLAVLRRARLEVAAELYHRRGAPAGVLAQFSDIGGTPVRMARNPMLAAYPILAPYVLGGFA